MAGGGEGGGGMGGGGRGGGGAGGGGDAGGRSRRWRPRGWRPRRWRRWPPIEELGDRTSNRRQQSKVLTHFHLCPEHENYKLRSYPFREARVSLAICVSTPMGGSLIIEMGG